MYLDLSAFTSSPISLVATTKASAFSFQEEIKSRLKLGNACYHSVQIFVFQFAIQKVKDQDIQNYNFVRCPVWV